MLFKQDENFSLSTEEEFNLDDNLQEYYNQSKNLKEKFAGQDSEFAKN